MQINTTARYHFTPAKRVIERRGGRITDVDKNMEKLELLCIAGQSVNGASAVENSLVVSQNVKHRTTISCGSCTSWRRCKRIESRDMNKYLDTQVHSHIFHSSQKVETTRVSIDKRMDRQNGVYTCSRILFSLKMECNLMSAAMLMDLENILSEISTNRRTSIV